eukprot:COSAG01_NODE_579_length_15238_cov_10.570183_3_plen_88_part_00
MHAITIVYTHGPQRAVTQQPGRDGVHTQLVTSQLVCILCPFHQFVSTWAAGSTVQLATTYLTNPPHAAATATALAPPDTVIIIGLAE